MPRDRGGIGRTGNKHKKKATDDLNRRLESPEGDAVQPSATALHKVTNMTEELNAGTLLNAAFAQDSNHDQCTRLLLFLVRSPVHLYHDPVRP